MTRRQIVAFISGLLIVSWTVQSLILGLTGGIESPDGARYLVGVMFLPGLFGVAFTILVAPVRRDVEWRPASLSPIALAMFVPVLIALVAVGLVELTGVGSSDYFDFGSGSVEIASGPWVLGIGRQTWPVFAANILVTTAVYSAMSALVVIGEEYGWRGVLQNAMIREFGFGQGVALLGLAWAAWHVPIILSGYNYPHAPILGALVLMPVLLIAASFIIALLTLWNRSFWPAVFMHGSINSVYDSVMSKVTLENAGPMTTKYLEVGLFFLIATGAYFVARPLARRLSRQESRVT